MAFQNLLFARRDDELRDLRGKEPPQTAHALDLAQLLSNALFERAIPLSEFFCLSREALDLLIDGVVQLLDAQN